MQQRQFALKCVWEKEEECTRGGFVRARLPTPVTGLESDNEVLLKLLHRRLQTDRTDTYLNLLMDKSSNTVQNGLNF